MLHVYHANKKIKILIIRKILNNFMKMKINNLKNISHKKKILQILDHIIIKVLLRIKKKIMTNKMIFHKVNINIKRFGN